MSVTEKIADLEPLLVRFRRALTTVDADVELALATASPLVRLGMHLPAMVDRLHAYRAARAAFIELGGLIMRQAYELHLGVILKEAQQLGEELRTPLLHELRAWDRYISDLADLRKLTVVPVSGKVVLTGPQQDLMRALLRRVQGAETGFEPAVQATWRQYLRAVGVHQDDIWQPTLLHAEDLARDIANMYGKAGLTQPWWENLRFANKLNPVQGGLFEPYARAAMQLIGEVDHTMRVAGSRAGHLGPKWTSYHANSEMFMNSMPRKAFDELTAAGAKGPVSIKGWKQFADDGALAVKVERWTGETIGEAEAVALMEFKAEEKSRLADKLIDFHRRHAAAGDTDTVVLVKFLGPVRDGKRAEIVCALRPPASDAPISYYAVAAGRDVPRAAELNALGIDQRSVRLPITRDAVRKDLSINLVNTILEKLLR